MSMSDLLKMKQQSVQLIPPTEHHFVKPQSTQSFVISSQKPLCGQNSAPSCLTYYLIFDHSVVRHLLFLAEMSLGHLVSSPRHLAMSTILLLCATRQKKCRQWPCFKFWLHQRRRHSWVLPTTQQKVSLFQQVSHYLEVFLAYSKYVMCAVLVWESLKSA